MPRMVLSVEFDRKFSIGNVWTIAVVVFGGGVVYATTGAADASQTKDMRAVELRVTALENNFASLLRELGSERVKQTEILTRIQSDIQYIKER